MCGPVVRISETDSGLHRDGAATLACTCLIASGRLAFLHPATERLDAIRIPRRVARHRTGCEHAENGVGVRTDVVVGPEVEVGGHRSPVAFAEQRLDVAVEAHGLSGHAAPPLAGDDC